MKNTNTRPARRGRRGPTEVVVVVARPARRTARDTLIGIACGVATTLIAEALSRLLF